MDKSKGKVKLNNELFGKVAGGIICEEKWDIITPAIIHPQTTADPVLPE